MQISSRNVLAAPKPRRGWPVYRIEAHIVPFFLFFGGAALDCFYVSMVREPRNLLGIRFANAAPPKNKRNIHDTSVTNQSLDCHPIQLLCSGSRIAPVNI